MIKQLQGFKPIKIAFSNETSTKHTMFMKEHSTRNQTDDKPIGRTLYLLNVPPWADEAEIKNAFVKHAPVVSVTFQNFNDTRNTGFKNAFIVCATEKSLHDLLNVKYLTPLSTNEHRIDIGLQKHITQYNKGLLNQHIREQEMLKIIKEYDAEETLKKTNKSDETDGEGWTLVTKKGRNPGLSRKESVNEKLMEKGKKEKTLKNFYRHQIRQAKRDQLAVLRKKAEEDKKKILALKQRRAFKPY